MSRPQLCPVYHPQADGTERPSHLGATVVGDALPCLACAGACTWDGGGCVLCGLLPLRPRPHVHSGGSCQWLVCGPAPTTELGVHAVEATTPFLGSRYADEPAAAPILDSGTLSKTPFGSPLWPCRSHLPDSQSSHTQALIAMLGAIRWGPRRGRYTANGWQRTVPTQTPVPAAERHMLLRRWVDPAETAPAHGSTTPVYRLSPQHERSQRTNGGAVASTGAGTAGAACVLGLCTCEPLHGAAMPPVACSCSVVAAVAVLAALPQWTPPNALLAPLIAASSRGKRHGHGLTLEGCPCADAVAWFDQNPGPPTLWATLTTSWYRPASAWSASAWCRPNLARTSQLPLAPRCCGHILMMG